MDIKNINKSDKRKLVGMISKTWLKGGPAPKPSEDDYMTLAGLMRNGRCIDIPF